MGFGTPDGFSNSGLGLGLGCHDKQETGSPSDHHRLQPKKKPSLKYDHFIPSLTLGPATKIESDTQPKASSLSPVSSFSNSSSVKKEREFGDEEVEVERVISRGCDEDEEPSPRKKLRLTKEQAAVLEDSFKEQSSLNPKQKQALADQLNLRPRQVEVWFQNRRARTKLKQTEVEFELLKKCCETLTDENNRLQKELQELKSVKPLYMQLPAATLTMCPSCERIGSGSGGDGPSTTAFVVGRNPSLYDSFTHQPAAC